MRVAIIARIKQSVVDKHRSAQQAAAAAGRGVCKCGPINIRAARIMSSQEVAALPPVKPAHSSQSEEDWDTDEEVRTPPCITVRSAHPYFRPELRLRGDLLHARRAARRGPQRRAPERRWLLQPPGMLTGVAGAQQKRQRSRMKRRMAGLTRRTVAAC